MYKNVGSVQEDDGCLKQERSCIESIIFRITIIYMFRYIHVPVYTTSRARAVATLGHKFIIML